MIDSMARIAALDIDETMKTIKDLPEHSRPREKLQENGPAALTDDTAGKPQEHFVCISLNGANEVIEKRVVTIGLLDKSPVHPREVFADVIADRAAAVIFAHNHPSGEVEPSEADVRVHEQLTAAGKTLGLRVLDHVIVTRNGHFSFREAALIR